MSELEDVRIDSDENSSLSSLASKQQVKNVQESSTTDALKNLSIDNEPFYFETDTLALRNNSDYSCLLKTLILLEGQRIKACNDLEKLIDLKEEANNDPMNFVNNLNKNNSTITSTSNLPSRQKVYILPEIDWNKYYDCVDLEDLEAIKNQKLNRVQSLRQTNKIIQQMEKSSENNNNTAGRSSSRRQAKDKPMSEKPIKNYNKSWSVEEQRHLEELLIEFPPEENEAARWRRIATKLGTRTPLQVQSHCQKYFIKLAKAGLPIPGRMPNLKTYVTKKGNRGKGKSSFMRGSCSSGIGGGRARLSGLNTNNGKRMVGRGVNLNEISSMWTSFNPPITMNDENEFDDEYENDYQNNYEDENQGEYNEEENYYDEDEDEYEQDEEEEADNDDSNTENSNSQSQNNISNNSNTNFSDLFK